jgi:hypothetical protein
MLSQLFVLLQRPVGTYSGKSPTLSHDCYRISVPSSNHADSDARTRLIHALEAVAEGINQLCGADQPFQSTARFLGNTDPSAAKRLIEVADRELTAFYQGEVLPTVLSLVGDGEQRRPIHSWIMKPVKHVLGSGVQLTFFGLFAIAVSDGEDRALVAAWATVVRATGLVLNDVAGKSAERQSRKSAYAIYGAVRCVFAATYTAASLMCFVCLGSVGLTTRLRRIWLTLDMGFGMRVLAPWWGRSIPSQLRRAKLYFSNIWWAMFAGLESQKELDIAAVKEIIGHYSLAVKLLNDLRDYYGHGSKSAFEDLQAHRITLPVLFLFTEYFFEGRGTLEPSSILALFSSYEIGNMVASTALHELRAAADLASGSGRLPEPAKTLFLTIIQYAWAQTVAYADPAALTGVDGATQTA